MKVCEACLFFFSPGYSKGKKNKNTTACIYNELVGQRGRKKEQNNL